MGVSDQQVVGEEREIEGGEPPAHVHGRGEGPRVLAGRSNHNINNIDFWDDFPDIFFRVGR